MRKNSLADRLRYSFDNAMSKGSGALVGWLGLLTLLLVALVTAVVALAGIAPADASGAEPGLIQLAWADLMRVMDPGMLGSDSGSWPYLLAMFVATIGGIFVFSTLIGVLTTGIEAQIEKLRKGRSRVLETGHTVILGWSSQVFPIISELVIANANRPRACIVILGDVDKVEMEDAIRDRVGHTGRVRIVCRTGSPIEMADLEIVNLHSARAIIIVSPEADDPDSHVLKTMLAITNNPQRRPEPYHIVAELHDPQNLDVAHIVGKSEVELVLVGDLISRVVAQTCRQSGLSAVYTELLDFGGDEIYFQEEPALVGRTFADTLLAYEDSAVIGIKPKDGAPHLNPPMGTCLGPGDQLIAVSEDDDTIRLPERPRPAIQHELIQRARGPQAEPERTLILGWNWRAASIIKELDHYIAPGSSLTVVASLGDVEATLHSECGNLRNQALTFVAGETTNRRILDSLAIPTYDHVIVLSYSDDLDAQAADARTLISLLHLRDIAERSGHTFSITSEMLDVRNRNLAEVTHADDFIVSDRLVSLMLSQVSENKALNAVFADIFDPEGSEIYMKPAGNYIRLGEPVNFYTVVAAASGTGEVAFGYRLHALAADADQSYGVFINPDKSVPVTFGPEDKVIVLAEE